ncbi:hypothetical protein [uncultured Amaricoccus sp.]|uniref:hypothetical protein n=1 Tax=uncultured Amaricoccus sp. TaxID=339341 RepID=UPI002632711B|nr:hypothetical protein [uncultured Amaricoccus sp.]
MPRDTYVSGLRAALAIANKRAKNCRKEANRHRSGNTNFTPEANAAWEKIERQCAMEAECIAGKIGRLIDTATRDLKQETHDGA